MQAVPAFVGAGAALVQVLSGRAVVLRNVAMLALVGLLLGLALLALARAVLAGRRWARSPAITWQLLLAAVGWYVFTAPQRLAGVAVVVLAAVSGYAVVRAVPVQE